MPVNSCLTYRDKDDPSQDESLLSVTARPHTSISSSSSCASNLYLSCVARFSLLQFQGRHGGNHATCAGSANACPPCPRHQLVAQDALQPLSARLPCLSSPMLPAVGGSMPASGSASCCPHPCVGVWYVVSSCLPLFLVVDDGDAKRSSALHYTMGVIKLQRRPAKNSYCR